MPERPLPPDLPNLLRDMLKRLDNVERARLVLPEGTDPLQTFEDGSPLGDTRFIDFGASLVATKVGDNYIRVDGFGGGPGGWDAIVEAGVTSQPSQRIFRQIGEALTYLKNIVGLKRAAIMVRGDGAGLGGEFVETANWSNPDAVLIFGVPQDYIPVSLGPQGGVSASYPTWNHGVFNGEGAGFEIYNMRIEAASSATKLSLFAGSLYAENSHFQLFNLFVTLAVATDRATYIGCSFDNFRPLGTYVNIRDGDLYCRGQTVSLTTGTTAFDQISGNFRMFNDGTSVFNCPPTVNLAIECVHSTRIGGSGGGWGGGLTVNAQAGTFGAGFRLVTVGPDSFFVNATIPAGFINHYEILGQYNTITVSNTANFAYGRIDAACASGDIRGPCTINLALIGNSVTLRGTGIVGNFAWRRDYPAVNNGATLRYVDCDQSNIVASMTLTGTATAGTKPYDFDASSSNNILLLTGITFPSAGTDSGTNNRVLPDAAPPAGGIAPADADYLVGTANGSLSGEIVVGTTPGGELGNTWASPTIDTTHSGSSHAGVIAAHEGDADPHTSYQRESEKNAASGYPGLNAGGGLTGIGNSAAATTPGAVVKKVEIFDAAGTSLGFIAVYDSLS